MTHPGSLKRKARIACCARQSSQDLIGSGPRSAGHLNSVSKEVADRYTVPLLFRAFFPLLLGAKRLPVSALTEFLYRLAA